MRKFKQIALVILVILIWTALVGFGFINGFLLRPITSGDSPEAFIEATEEKIADEFVGNFAMTLIEDGEIAKHYFYAVDEPVDENSVFQVASVSKWVTSFGILNLVEQGKLDLDAPIDQYLTRWHLPESEFDNEKVTIRRLLSHSSGLVDGMGYYGFAPDEEVQSIEQSLTKASDAPYSDGVAKVGYEPGTEYQYSGAGYTILQLIIEEVTGQSFQEYMTQAVFEPLNMDNSTFVLSEKPGLKLAQLYNEDGTISPPIKFTALAAASLYTTTADLSKFMMANIAGNKVLKQETIAKMTAPETYRNNIPVYGLGPHLYSQKDKNSKIVGHDGSSARPLINTAARIDIKSKDGIIILEMGNQNIASSMADEWMFWKAGIADYVVMQRNIPYLLTLLGIGVIIIIVSSIFVIRKKNRHNKAVHNASL